MYEIGINAGAYGNTDVSKVIPMLSRIGFDSFFTLWSEELPIEAWANIAEKNNIKYQSIHGPWKYADYIWRHSEEGDIAVKRLKMCLDSCSNFGVPIMVVHPRIGFEQTEPTNIGLKRWSEVVEYAEKKNVSVGFENLEGENFLAAVMKEFGSSRAVGFCWDTGHEFCYNLDNDMIALYGDRLISTHLNDNRGCTSSDRCLSTKDDLHLLPFDGKLDWKDVMRKIRSAEYGGILTFEVKSKDDGVHDKYMKMSCEEFFSEAYLRARRVAAL